MPKPKKINYTGSSKIINALVGIGNWALDNSGTNVEANPAESATDSLGTVLIDDTVYDLGLENITTSDIDDIFDAVFGDSES